MKSEFSIDDKYGLNFPTKKLIKKIVKNIFELGGIYEKSALSEFKIDTISFDIVFTDDVEIRTINKEYRKKDSATDVITFALFADDDSKFVFDKRAELGEIIISVETAARQAVFGLEKEIATLICHGILHLIGFDHLTDEDYNFVVSIQEKVTAKL